MSASTTILLFNLVLYVLVIIAFSQARSVYAGGKMEQIINLILAMAVLMFLSDYAQVLKGILSDDTIFTLRTILRTAALAALAFGGIRMSGKI